MKIKEIMSSITIRRTLPVLGVLMCLVALLLAYLKHNWPALWVSGLLLFIHILGFLLLRRRRKGVLPPYIPGKGYWYYRMTPHQKIRHLTIGQGLLLLGLAIFWSCGLYSNKAATVVVGGILTIETILKPRIKRHTPYDKVSHDKLRMLGFIEPGEILHAVYHDFEQWYRIPKNSVVLALTDCCLNVIRMSSHETGIRHAIALCEISDLHLAVKGSIRQGLVISLRLRDGTLLNIELSGKSRLDSPERFAQLLLESLDRIKRAG